MKPLIFERNANGTGTREIQPSDYVVNLVLEAGTAKSVSVPAQAGFVLLNATANVFVDWSGAAAVVPSADVTDGTGVELNPTRRALGDTSSFSVISESACTVCLSFYR